MDTLLDGTDWKIPLDGGATMGFMSKQYYVLCMYKYTYVAQVKLKSKIYSSWNGASVNILFIISIIITIQGHIFEIYGMISKIHDNAYLVLKALLNWK